MTEQTNLVPKRRFKEFQNTRAWEQHMFSELVSRVSTSNDDRGLPRVEFEDIVSGLGQLNKNIFQKESVKKGIEFKPGDTLFGKLRPYLKNWLMPDFKGIAVGDFWVLRPNDIDSKFIYLLIQSNKYQTVANLTTGTKMPRSDWGVVSKTEFEVPFSVEEQAKIGNFFKQLDEIIVLHQRMLEKTKALKSAYLTEMFPAEGECEPKRRFAEYTHAWEQSKFIEILDAKDGIRRGPFGSALKKDLFVPKSDYVVYEQQNAIYDKWETRYNITQEKFAELHKFVLSEGDFIMSGAGTIGRIAKVPEGIKQGVFNQALIRFKINPDLIDSNYFLQWIRSDNMQRKFTGANPGSAMTNLVPMSEVKKWVVSLPSLAEQKKIAEFFAKLSDTIALHQLKLEKLQNIKKAYLNEMFV